MSLEVMGDCLLYRFTHDAVLLLHHSFAIPKLLYIYTLRSSPCSLSPLLQDYDHQLEMIVSGIVNIHLNVIDPAWTQVPVKFGGPWVQSAVQLVHPLPSWLVLLLIQILSTTSHLLISKTSLSCIRRMLWLSGPKASTCQLLKVLHSSLKRLRTC